VRSGHSRITRRALLQTAVGGAAAVAVGGLLPRPAAANGSTPQPPLHKRRLLVVIFGGGTRSSESMADTEHRYVPRLWQELAPQGTFFTNMRVEGRVVHTNCNASIKTGHWEYDDLDWSKPPKHPTIFEIVRKDRGLPDTAAWSFVYASILSKTGWSRAEGYGQLFAANVVEPPTIPRATAEEMERLMKAARDSGSPDSEQIAAARCARLARTASQIAEGGLQSDTARRWLNERYSAWRKADGTSSHDAFLADCACDCMKRFSPQVMSVDFGEIDCAHYGAWSLYVEAIRRTDELTWRLWQTAQSLSEYRSTTLMLVLPDHGRQLETPGGPDFLHHSDFYTNRDADEGCRHVWMLAVGPGVARGATIERPTPITAAAATGLHWLGIDASPGAAPPCLHW
jgi:hypothetical protein